MGAEFNSNRGEYTPLQPFKYWCEKILPLTYDDSVSYYELLCKVVEYLNYSMDDVTTLNEDMTALYESYSQLQGYVNTYFDNLDVQQEIDNKLDAMVVDGTLTRLVRPFVGEAVSDWLEDNVTPVGSAVIVDATLSIPGAAADAKATGDALSGKQDILSFDNTPTAGSGNPVRSAGIKTYVDGSVANVVGEIADLRQDTEDEIDELRGDVEDEITDVNERLDDVTDSFLDYLVENTVALSWTQGYLINTNGNIGADSARCVSNFIEPNGNSIFFELGDYVLEKIMSFSNNTKEDVYTNINATGRYTFTEVTPGLRYRAQIRNKTETAITPSSITGFSVFYYSPDTTLSLANKVADSKAVGDNFNGVYSRISEIVGGSVDETGVTTEAGYYINATNGTKTEHQSEIYGCSDYIDIKDYQNMKMSFTALFNGSAGIAFYDASKIFISGVSGTTIGNSTNIQTIETIVPERASYVRLTIKATESLTITDYPIEFVGSIGLLSGSLNELRETVDNVAMKYASLSMFEKIGVIGDSYASGEIFVNGSGADYYNLSWGQNIARLCGIDCTNYSKGGLTTKTWLSNATYGLSKLLSDTARQLYMICLGLNDSTAIGQGTYSLGTSADMNVDYTQNPDTFYGNYGRIIGNIKTHAPNAKIIICTVTEGNVNDFATVNNAIETIAEAQNIPLMNLKEDPFFLSAYYRNCMVSNHPTAISYSGYAEGIMRLFSKCVAENINYFKDYIG